MNIDSKAAEAVVNFIAAAAPVIDEAEQLEKAAAQKSAAVEKAIPGVVDTLVKGGYLTNDQRIKAAESLKNPVTVLETLQRIALATAIKSAEEAKSGLGSSSTPNKDTKPTVKKASVSQESAADQHFLRSFGLA
jgi:hypothetical protein